MSNLNNMALFPKIKKGWLIAVVAIIILASLNPTYTDFKEFTGLAGTQSKHLHKKANFLICSVYTNDLDYKRYLGLAKNFIDITPKPVPPPGYKLDTPNTFAPTTVDSLDSMSTTLMTDTNSTSAVNFANTVGNNLNEHQRVISFLISL